MVVRNRWEVRNGTGEPAIRSENGQWRRSLRDIVESNSLSVHYQPVVSARDGSIFGYEALARLAPDSGHPFENIPDLFRRAKDLNMISSLDTLCRGNAIRQAARIGVNANDRYLFVNVCPETLMDPEHKTGLTDGIVEECAFPKDRIIFEITEESCIENYKLFKEAVAYYRTRGYKIAIDDFGAGHGGLKMLSIIEPNFVKIDRHFISNIDKAMIKFNLVDSIVTACHRIGIKVIAEGIETGEELDVVLDMGVELLQGYHIGRPAADLAQENGLHERIRKRSPRQKSSPESSHKVIGDICRKVDAVAPSFPFSKATKLFISMPALRSLPVVDDGRCVGMLHRTRFLEQQIVGRYGYAMHLNSYKTIDAVMETQFLTAEATAPLESVAQRINARKAEFLYDDVCVTRNGKYFGIVAISGLLDAITERSLAVARGSNPLTGLPGNAFIQREIEKRLSQNMHFDVCYLDLDNFKPFNDHYGFERGDLVIKTLASIIDNALSAGGGDDCNFVGHIGGDDFIVITRPQLSIPFSEAAVAGLMRRLPEFHTADDMQRGSYVSTNRKGEAESFPLLSLSIGIVSTEVCKIESYAQLASIASEVKKTAKTEKGSSIVRDRRLKGKTVEPFA